MPGVAPRVLYTAAGCTHVLHCLWQSKFNLAARASLLPLVLGLWACMLFAFLHCVPCIYRYIIIYILHIYISSNLSDLYRFMLWGAITMHIIVYPYIYIYPLVTSNKKTPSLFHPFSWIDGRIHPFSIGDFMGTSHQYLDTVLEITDPARTRRHIDYWRNMRQKDSIHPDTS